MKKKKKKSLEFSKKIFYIIMLLFIIIIGFSMLLMWKTENTDALSYLIPSISGLAATCVGFYYNKSKLENEIKLKKRYGISLDSINFETDIESEE